jgi:hypothetical protein
VAARVPDRHKSGTINQADHEDSATSTGTAAVKSRAGSLPYELHKLSLVFHLLTLAELGYRCWLSWTDTESARQRLQNRSTAKSPSAERAVTTEPNDNLVPHNHEQWSDTCKSPFPDDVTYSPVAFITIEEIQRGKPMFDQNNYCNRQNYTKEKTQAISPLYKWWVQ